MSVLAIGVDLVAVVRVERMLERHGERALKRLLTDEERVYCASRAAPAVHVAARLAAKEAAYKGLAQAAGARTIGWREIEVVRHADGRPALALHGRALKAAHRLRVRSVLVSLTHVQTHGAAVVVLVG